MLLFDLSLPEPTLEQGVWTFPPTWNRNRNECKRGTLLKGNQGNIEWGAVETVGVSKFQYDFTASHLVMPFTKHLEFIFFCHKVT